MTGGSPGGPGLAVTVRRGAGPTEPAAPARRLTLTRAEWAALVAGRLGDVPPGFAAPELAVPDREAAVASLVRRHVLHAADGRSPAEPAPAVAANLEVLRRPVVSLRLDVTGRGGARQGWFAVASGLVAGVLALPGGGVELSLAPDVRLGEELARAVPEAFAVTGPGFPEEPAGRNAVPTGRIPLALLDDVASPQDAGPVPSPAEAALAEELLQRTAGSLSCLVLGRAGVSVGAGQVSWLATDGGWAGLRPVLGGAPERRVDVVPVGPGDLGAWVAPTVAVLLAESDGLS